MAKKQTFNLHKIKLHPNRWMLWAIAYTLIIAVGMIGYIKVSDVDFEVQAIAQQGFQPWHNYKDTRLGFTLRYPADWTIEAENSSTINFSPANTADEGVSISVIKPTDEKTLRKTLDILSEQRIKLDGNKAVKIINNLGAKHTETFVMSLKNQHLYVLRGSESEIQKLLLTFHFIK